MILLNGAVLNILPAEEKEETVLAVVFDIGTTSVVGYLLNMKTGSQISCVSSLNEQRKIWGGCDHARQLCTGKSLHGAM